MGERDPQPADPYRSARRTLPVLDDLRVASPCDVPWDSMLGNGRVRHCARCSKQVFNISAMSRADAEIFLLERARGACLHFYRRADGTLITADCTVGRRLQLRGQAMFALATTMFAYALAVVGGRVLSTKVTQSVQSASTGGDWSCERPARAADR